MHDIDAVLARQVDDTMEELEVDALRGRVAREAQDHHLRLRQGFADCAFEFGKEIDAAVHAHRADVSAGDDRAIDMDRVARVRHQYRVAAIERGEHQVREAFLRADRDDRFRVGIELDAVTRLVPVGDRTPQARDALGDRIAVRVLALGCLDQLVDDVPGRRPVRIAHAHVDDVFAAATRGHLQLTCDVEDIKGQALDARKLDHLPGPEAMCCKDAANGGRRCDLWPCDASLVRRNVCL